MSTSPSSISQEIKESAQDAARILLGLNGTSQILKVDGVHLPFKGLLPAAFFPGGGELAAAKHGFARAVHGWVGVGVEPRNQLQPQLAARALPARVVDKVCKLPGVAGKVVQLVRPVREARHVLDFVRTDHAHEAVFVKDHHVPRVRARIPLQNVGKAAAGQLFVRPIFWRQG